MILYVETNFVLELAFGQEEHGSCRALVGLAREIEALRLTLPAFCIGEAYDRQIRRQREREVLQRGLAAEIGELSRSPFYTGRLGGVGEVSALLAQRGETERRSLDLVIHDLCETGTLIELGEAAVREAQGYQYSRGLSPQDALVYASVLGHLRRSGDEDRVAEGESCFVTRDNDFADDDVRADLEALGCKLLFRFEDALGYVRSRFS